MTWSPIKQRRRAIRLRDYDYEQAGAYFVTICTQERACLFGVIQDDKVCLNDAGRTIEKWWFELNRKFPMVETDEFVIMPNHFHGVVIITDVPVGADLRVGPVPEGGHPTQQGAHAGAPLQAVIQWFKTMTTNEYIRGVKTASWPAFNGRLWQRNYYEHVIRDDQSLNRIRHYIVDNPARWEFDPENRGVTNPEPADAWRVGAGLKPAPTRED
jgi:putative transposase